MTPIINQRRRELIRSSFWAALAVIAVVELVVALAPMPDMLKMQLSYCVSYYLPMALTVIGAGLLTLRVRGVERRFWFLLMLASICVFTVEIFMTWYQWTVDARGPRMPHPSELGHLAAITIFYVLVVSMTEFGNAPRVTRLRTYLDVIGGCAVAYAFVYWYWTLPLFVHDPYGGWAAAVVAAIYPVAGGLMLLTTALIVWGWKAYAWRTWERLVSASFAIYGLGLIIFPGLYSAWIANPVLKPIDFYTIVLGSGFYLLFMAIVYRFTDPVEAARVEPWSVPTVRPVWVLSLYPAVIALGFLLIGGVAFRNRDILGDDVLGFVAVFLSVELIVRSWLGSIELAHHRASSITDPVTGAFNQRYLYQALPGVLAEAKTAGTCVAIVALDIADFRSLSEQYGHDAGDRVLTMVSETLTSEAPPGAIVGRVGRDEFVAVLPGATVAEASRLAHRTSARVSSEVNLGTSVITLSIGITMFPEHGEDPAELISKAIASQQLARAASDADVVVYDPDIVDAAEPIARLSRARMRSHRSQLRALAAAVDARDADTRFHSDSVAEIAGTFALFLELGEEQTLTLELASRLHDVGKVVVPDDVLLKPGALDDDEMRLVQVHPEMGERIVAPSDQPELLAAIRHHHECWDGAGYPDGIAGEKIPFEARVLAICDAFEAMTSPRRYRPAFSTAQAVAEISRCAGTQFDPELAETFSRMVVRMHGRPISHRMAASRRDLNEDAEPPA